MVTFGADLATRFYEIVAIEGNMPEVGKTA
jgi:hypothetical protein